MANKTKPEEVVSIKEALNMEIIINQALIDLLVAKGVITKEEILAKIEEIRTKMFQANAPTGNGTC